MAEALVLGGIGTSMSWSWAAETVARSTSDRRGQRQETRRPAARTGGAWLSAEDVARLLLQGECMEVGVSVPERFAPAALQSALESVERWTRERRIFSIHELYPRYQFDAYGRPYPAIERALAVLGHHDTLRVGNWFSGRNPHLDGLRPSELLATSPEVVLSALRLAV